jgi:hypothetical protein
MKRTTTTKGKCLMTILITSMKQLCFVAERILPDDLDTAEMSHKKKHEKYVVRCMIE